MNNVTPAQTLWLSAGVQATVFAIRAGVDVFGPAEEMRSVSLFSASYFLAAGGAAGVAGTAGALAGAGADGASEFQVSRM